jgi:hypothetical protein
MPLTLKDTLIAGKKRPSCQSFLANYEEVKV